MSEVERFMAKVDRPTADGCWVWTAGVDVNGYGRFSAGGRSVYAHRWSYEHFVGLIPEGFTVIPSCRVRACMNPSHLEAVTGVEARARVRTVGKVLDRQREWAAECPLRCWRRVNGLSLVAAAATLGVSTTTVQNWEGGAVMPDGDNWDRLVEVIGGESEWVDWFNRRPLAA